MEEALSFFRAFEVWIYLLLGLGGLLYVRKFVLSWQDLRAAAFGLERESAQARLNQSAGVLVFLLSMAVMEFVLVSFVAPAVPAATPLLTPTLDLLATPSVTLAPVTALAEGAEVTAQPEATGPVLGSGCIAGQVEIVFPQEGGEISGLITVLGVADIPNFGFFKYEMKRPGDTVWLTIQAGDKVVQNGEKLGDWDTRRLPPGEYELGLVVVDNQARASPHCTVRVRVSPAIETAEP